MRKETKSFYDWCIENNHEDWLLLWDYELNGCSPKEVSRGTQKKYYFKCPKGLHESEQKWLHSFANSGIVLKCNQCNSFEQWCIKNNHEDWLELWDYSLNDCSPSEISYSTHNKYFFKCKNGIHKSEKKMIHNLANENVNLKCNQCNSFGQHLINTFGENALELYWDYEKNKINPFDIAKNSHEDVWIKCRAISYHPSYKIQCSSFYKGNRCPYCSNKKVHPKDSFAQYHIDNTDPDFIEKYWSEKNTIDPFSIAPNSTKFKVLIKCQNFCKHDDYKVESSSFTKGSRCPKCKESKGEKEIRKYLNNNKINFIAQKKFPNLYGIKNGYLSYDFYLPEQNLLIEYQGQYHDGTGINQTQERFEYQQEHDQRKREYAEQNGIRLLEIWYWDYDNVESILAEALNIDINNNHTNNTNINTNNLINTYNKSSSDNVYTKVKVNKEEFDFPTVEEIMKM